MRKTTKEQKRQRDIAYKAANLEKRKDYVKNNKELIAIIQKRYNDKNKEKNSIQKKSYYQANKEKIAIRDKARYEANKLLK